MNLVQETEVAASLSPLACYHLFMTMTDIETKIQKLSPSPGDILIVTVPDGLVDLVREERSKLSRMARRGGYYIALTSAPLTVEHLNNEEGRSLVMQLAAALEERNKER